ncbi:MAG: A/G-specific adenine glycosylase [Dorea sp.]|jgi:A/G-specific adenine glycosylase|nr:A/G-specific adenine glycosylase [Dorea sp.]
MKYKNICQGKFIDRPNRFIAHVEIDGCIETVHVKNTGRCRELLIPGAVVYVQNSFKPERKTKWDMIAVEKDGQIINMDSQIPNKVVKEWLGDGNFIKNITSIQSEYTYGNSRIDLYVEAGKRKILIEVKGVTLEEDGIVRFPDAPSERAVKHVHELTEALKEGYESYVFFVVQMKCVRYFKPNTDTHPEFAKALRQAVKEGVRVAAYDCLVEKDSISIYEEVPVVLEELSWQDQLADLLIPWYRKYQRALPWREEPKAYEVWVSEIMLQQTRVEAVKPYYVRFMKELPTVKALAEAKEDQLLKLWEGLGYYNRVRNMQKAAQQIMVDFDGEFPGTFEKIRALKGIGSYTAGAICSFAFGIPVPAVDGNVLRVITRLTADESDIGRQSTKRRIEQELEKIIPKEAASDFNQALIELGAIICVPNGRPKCDKCPLALLCEAKKHGLTESLPVKMKAKARRIEKKTILILRDGDRIAIRKRKEIGLLAGLYELPNVEGHLDADEVVEYCKEIGLMPVRIKALSLAKHIFSHVEWHMTGYLIKVDELEKTNNKEYLFIHPEEIEAVYPIPSAFEKYMQEVKTNL